MLCASANLRTFLFLLQLCSFILTPLCKKLRVIFETQLKDRVLWMVNVLAPAGSHGTWTLSIRRRLMTTLLGALSVHCLVESSPGPTPDHLSLAARVQEPSSICWPND